MEVPVRLRFLTLTQRATLAAARSVEPPPPFADLTTEVTVLTLLANFSLRPLKGVAAACWHGAHLKMARMLFVMVPTGSEREDVTEDVFARAKIAAAFFVGVNDATSQQMKSNFLCSTKGTPWAPGVFSGEPYDVRMFERHGVGREREGKGFMVRFDPRIEVAGEAAPPPAAPPLRPAVLARKLAGGPAEYRAKTAALLFAPQAPGVTRGAAAASGGGGGGVAAAEQRRGSTTSFSTATVTAAMLFAPRAPGGAGGAAAANGGGGGGGGNGGASDLKRLRQSEYDDQEEVFPKQPAATVFSKQPAATVFPKQPAATVCPGHTDAVENCGGVTAAGAPCGGFISLD